MPETVTLVGAAFVVVFILWVYNLCGERRRRARLINMVPGPPTNFIFGNALDLHVEHSEILNVLARWSTEFMSSGIFRLWLGPQPWVVVIRSTFLEAVLNSSKHIEKSYEYNFLVPWLGSGLLTSTGDKWKSRRRLLTPAFHFRILEDFMQVYNEQSSILVRNLRKEVGKDNVDLFPYITLCTLDIICDTAMGQNVNAQEDSDSEYVKALYGIAEVIHSRTLRPWLWPDWFFSLTPTGREHNRCLKILHAFTTQVIQQRRREKRTLKEKEASGGKFDDDDAVMGKKRRKAFLDLLIDTSEDGAALSDLDIREEVDTFMFEGHDTTAAGISWSLYLLGLHPEVQKRVHEELDSIFGDSDRCATSEDLKEMKYLECVIKESLRLFPSVPFIGRHLNEDIAVDGYTIPAGATAIILIYMLHRDPEVFPDPERFDPERFLPENAQGRHPYAFVPFSAGPRNCIGQKFAMMEEKVVVSSILRNYSLTSLDPREELKVLAELILRPAVGLRVKLESRK